MLGKLRTVATEKGRGGEWNPSQLVNGGVSCFALVPIPVNTNNQTISGQQAYTDGWGAGRARRGKEERGATCRPGCALGGKVKVERTF